MVTTAYSQSKIPMWQGLDSAGRGGVSAAFSSSGVKLSRTCLVTLSWLEEMKEVNATQMRDIPWNDES